MTTRDQIKDTARQAGATERGNHAVIVFWSEFSTWVFCPDKATAEAVSEAVREIPGVWKGIHKKAGARSDFRTQPSGNWCSGAPWKKNA